MSPPVPPNSASRMQTLRIQMSAPGGGGGADTDLTPLAATQAGAERSEAPARHTPLPPPLTRTISTMRPCLTIFILLSLLASAAAQVKTAEFTTRDTLHVTPDADPQAQAVLDQLRWPAADFTVRAESIQVDGGDAVVSFPSPRPASAHTDVNVSQRVPLVWFAARDEAGQPIHAPALLMVHSLHPRMPFAAAFARGLSRRGVHVFILHLPGYGLRRDALPTPLTALLNATRSVADVRRARDAIAALPNIDTDRIGLSGISLGGFVAATAGSLDGAFDPVVLILSGVDGYAVLQNGDHDAAKVRHRMAEHGYVDGRLRSLLDAADPKYLVHRLDPRRTWLFSARDDRVIPRANIDAFVKRRPLDEAHHVWVAGNHYTAITALPAVLNQLHQIMITPPPPAPRP